MRSKRRRRRRRRSRRAGQNKNNPLEKAWDGKGYSNTTHPKAFARDLPIKLGPLARRRGMNNDNRVSLTLNPRSRRTKDLSNLAYYNTTRKERKAREKKSGGNRRRRRRRRSRRRRRGGKSPAPGSKSKGPVMRTIRVQPGYVPPVTRSQTKKARQSYKKLHARHTAAAARMGLEDKRGSSAPTATTSSTFRLPPPRRADRPSKAPKPWTPPPGPSTGGRRRRSRRRRRR